MLTGGIAQVYPDDADPGGFGGGLPEVNGQEKATILNADLDYDYSSQST